MFYQASAVKVRSLRDSGKEKPENLIPFAISVKAPWPQESNHHHCPDTVDRHYNILNKNEPYNAELYRHGNWPQFNREASVAEAIFILQRQGYLVSAPAP